MNKLDIKIENWKNKLLDLTKRNKLINYKLNNKNNIEIVKPNYLDLWEMFVVKEKEIIFPISKKSSNNDIEYDDFIEPNVKTNKTDEELQKILRKIRNTTKTNNEEKGVNTLFLSFGFLEWKESDNSEITYNSPLLLVPSNIIIESLTSPFKLKTHDDEIVVNPSIVYKFENEFGLKIPPFDENISLESYFEEVDKVISVQGFKVIREVGLNNFSFLKMNMYNDLLAHKDNIISNTLVQTIAGERVDKQNNDLFYNDESFFKEEKPIDMFQIVDADSSQQSAIIMAKKGKSFVLQGPPGTGKSQTITNIIAESLASGKKVLFVSEKMAALDVVHNKLSKAGLSDFCLVLHNHKANKKQVLEQLNKMFNLSHKIVTDEAYHKLTELENVKKDLDDYCLQIHEKIKPLNKSIYNVNGKLSNLESYPNLSFNINDVRNISWEDYNNLLSVVQDLASTLDNNSSYHCENPWKGCNIYSLNNEFRNDSKAKINKLISNLENTYYKINDVFNELSLDNLPSINSLLKILDILSLAIDGKTIPYEWLINDDIFNYNDEIQYLSNIKAEYLQLVNEIYSEYRIICNTNEIVIPELDKNADISVVDKLYDDINYILNNVAPYKYWNNVDYDIIYDLICDAFENASLIVSSQNSINQLFDDEIYLIDHKEILGRYKTDYNSIFKIFNSKYKKDKKNIDICRKDIRLKLKDNDRIWVLQELAKISNARNWFSCNQDKYSDIFGFEQMNENIDYDLLKKQYKSFVSMNNCKKNIVMMKNRINEINVKEIIMNNHYKFLYNGILTDWDNIYVSIEWTKLFKNKISEINLSEIFLKKICNREDFIDKCKSAYECIKDCYDQIKSDFDWLQSIFDNEVGLNNYSFISLSGRLKDCLNSYSSLEKWIDYRNAKIKCENYGLNEFISVIENAKINASEIKPTFEKTFYTKWLDSVLIDYPAVLAFRRRKHDDLVENFSKLDTLQFEIAKARIKKRLINNLPNLDRPIYGSDELSVLNRELHKKSKIMPLRKLFKQIPNLLMTLKPCLMMSPLSVSLFLEADSYNFDIVIFDEASQVFTENAIGAISRGKQVVIAGDSKQLPPTDFFNTSSKEEDYDEDDENNYDDVNAYESILDEANMLPPIKLKWHYRSKNEDLIAFSNAKIYKNDLITFPSNLERQKNVGVEYIYVKDGVYLGKQKKGNLEEANRIVDLIFEHFETFPQRSLGVIAFGQIQEQAIETALRNRRIENPKYESFFDEEKDECFFIKNLESVQGDERDTIIFSVGYAKDKDGIFKMSFGPLGKVGGERRLNVAITRAKINVKLVGSVQPNDFDLDRVTNDGPKLLKSYIDYAINGPDILDNIIEENDIVEHDSAFEEAVYKYLDNKGYKVVTQVGCSSYRIDMAVKHPKIKGVYVIGIECDGASYHSAKSTRERDRLRQSVLENHGWTIYRIWSTDWYKDPITEGSRLEEAIKNAIKKYDNENDEDIFYSSEKTDYTNIKSDNNSFLQNSILNEENNSNPYNFVKREEINYCSYCKNKYGWAFDKEGIREIINNEYPIHYELLCQLYAPFMGRVKASSEVRNNVDYLLYKYRSEFVQKGDFIYPVNYDHIPIRMPNNRKKPYLISPEEIAAAMLLILQKEVGLNKETLYIITLREYGFKHGSQNIIATLDEAYNLLCLSEKVSTFDDKIILL